MNDESVSSEGPERRRPRRLLAGFSIILIGIIGLALIMLMCIVVAALAYLRG